MPTIAAGSRRRLAYIPEVTWGTTPATPTLQILRNTGGAGIQMERNAQQSNEMRSDRAIADVRMGIQRASLDVPFELSYGTYDDLLEAALFGTWTTNVLKQGVTRRQFTFEEGFTDINVFIPARGGVVNTMQLQFQPEGAMVTGSFGLIFKAQGTATGTTLATATTPANTEPVFDSFKGSIKKGVTTLAVATQIDLNLNNNVDALFSLFNEEAFGVAVGRADLTGSFTAYFTGLAEINEFVNESEVALEIETEDLDGNSYLIEIPRVKWTGNTRNLTENTITQQIPFQALYDATEETTIKITRVDAV